MKKICAVLAAIICASSVCGGVYAAEAVTPENSVFDVNLDGTIGARDLVALMKYIANGRTDSETGSYDTNRDGKINSLDLVALMRHIAGISPEVDYSGSKDFEWDTELEDSIATKENSLNMLTATDDYGRTFNPISGNKEDKDRYVGLFYFLWIGQHGIEQTGIYNITNLINENKDAALFGTEKGEGTESPVGQYHYWAEPLYGYYNSMDPWVIRKHVELLTMAGVDFIVFDTTNAFTYFNVLNVLLPIMQEYYDAGWDVPKFVFYTNSSSNTVVNLLYKGYAGVSESNYSESECDLYNYGIYRDGRYKDLWFCPNGKPLIIAITRANKNASDQKGVEVIYSELLNFFEIKESQWPNTGVKNNNGFPWIEFTRPQTAYGDVVSVSVAQHQKLPFSDALLSSSLYDEMWGRGFTSENGANHSKEAIESGLNFEEQWKTALSLDPTYAFITGWNEWIALKQAGAPGNASYLKNGNYFRGFFVDAFNEEFSRDVEMMKGGYFDNFYLQMARNIRTYKSEEYTDIKYAENTEIDISKGLSQWGEVQNTYYDFSGDTAARDFDGMNSLVHYTDNSGRNDIEQVRVAQDEGNIFFLIKCSNKIIEDYTKNNWMNILIDIEGDTENTWYGYNYVINRGADSSGKTSVDRISYDGEKVSYITSEKQAFFTLNGEYLQVSVPKSALGIKGSNYRLDFKVTDNVADTEDMASFYTSGDSCPAGRVNYAFFGL